MTQANETTLRKVIEDYYGIRDRLIAEGKFVAIIDGHVNSLVCLGLSLENLVIADIVFSGSSMDYDVQSLIPVSVLSLSYTNDSRKIEIYSELRGTIVFQLCSCPNQAEVWKTFTSAIDKVYQQEQDQETDLSKSFGTQRFCLDLFRPESTESLSMFSYTESAFSTCSDISGHSAMLNESSLSLPTKLLSQDTTLLLDTISKYSSIEYLNVESEHIV